MSGAPRLWFERASRPNRALAALKPPKPTIGARAAGGRRELGRQVAHVENGLFAHQADGRYGHHGQGAKAVEEGGMAGGIQHIELGQSHLDRMAQHQVGFGIGKGFGIAGREDDRVSLGGKAAGDSKADVGARTKDQNGGSGHR